MGQIDKTRCGKFSATKAAGRIKQGRVRKCSRPDAGGQIDKARCDQRDGTDQARPGAAEMCSRRSNAAGRIKQGKGGMINQATGEVYEDHTGQRAIIGGPSLALHLRLEGRTRHDSD